MRTRKQSAAALRFATEVAARLDKVVPRGLSVRAVGTSVNVYAAHDDRHASAGAEIIGDEDGRTFAQRAEAAAWAILNGAQDGVMEILREQWPAGQNGRAAEPGTRLKGDHLIMWFGEEGEPLVSLLPLNLAEVQGAA